MHSGGVHASHQERRGDGSAKSGTQADSDSLEKTSQREIDASDSEQIGRQRCTAQTENESDSFAEKQRETDIVKEKQQEREIEKSDLCVLLILLYMYCVHIMYCEI